LQPLIEKKQISHIDSRHPFCSLPAILLPKNHITDLLFNRAAALGREPLAALSGWMRTQSDFQTDAEFVTGGPAVQKRADDAHHTGV
jgi:hypothetical protein